MSNTIIINGITYEGGSTILVKGNGTTTVDGKPLQGTEDSKLISITIQGNVDTLEVHACHDITVNGDIHSLNVKAGNVKCESVTGSVKSSAGTVTIGSIKNANFE